MRGMLHNLDVHSTFLPPNRYKRSPGHRRRVRRNRCRARARFHRRRAAGRAAVSDVDELAPGSPAEVAGIQLDDRVVAIDGDPPPRPARSCAKPARGRSEVRGGSGTASRSPCCASVGKSRRCSRSARAGQAVATVRSARVEPRVGYLAITRFAEATAADIAAALDELRRDGALATSCWICATIPAASSIKRCSSPISFSTTARSSRSAAATAPSKRRRTQRRARVSASPIDRARRSRHGVGRRDPRGRAPRSRSRQARRVADVRQGNGSDVLRSRRRLRPQADHRRYSRRKASRGFQGIVPDVRVEAFAPEEIVAGTDGKQGWRRASTVPQSIRSGARRSTARSRRPARRAGAPRPEEVVSAQQLFWSKARTDTTN